MTKQEKIQLVYESFGFEWDKCSKYITENGVLILPTPDLKYSLEGYENLIKDNDKFSAFGKEGLKIQPSLLKGIFNNNGWTKIESIDDLPSLRNELILFRNEGGFVTTWQSNDIQETPNYYMRYSHWKIKQKDLPPLY